MQTAYILQSEVALYIKYKLRLHGGRCTPCKGLDKCGTLSNRYTRVYPSGLAHSFDDHENPDEPIPDSEIIFTLHRNEPAEPHYKINFCHWVKYHGLTLSALLYYHTGEPA